MKKIVINDCFGGFSLSHAGIKRYAELAGFNVYRFGGCDYKNPRLLEDSEKESMFDFFRKGSDDESEFFSYRDIERDDPILIQVVEELGEKANGMCASLKIVEIPDDVDWEISEYDGKEHVAQKHQTWY